MERNHAPRRHVLLLMLAPLLLLAGVIALFAVTGGAGLNVRPAAPNEAIEFERTVLRPGVIELHIRNASAEEVTISQVNVNDAIWPFTVAPSHEVPRLGAAVLVVEYPWVQGEPYRITLFSGNAIAFSTDVVAATTTATVSAGTLVSFTLIGVYVGIVPVLLGMAWLPALRRLGRRAMLVLMAATVGLLIYLGIDTTVEAIEQAGALEGPLQGFGIAGIGLVGTVLLLDALSRRQMTTERSDTDRRMTLATLIAVGIGLHNLGEGLAIGAAYSVGAAARRLSGDRLHHPEPHGGPGDRRAPDQGATLPAGAGHAGGPRRRSGHPRHVDRRTGFRPGPVRIVPGHRLRSGVPGGLPDREEPRLASR